MTQTMTASADYAAVRHLLASPSLARRTAAHVREQDFDWPGIFAQEATMSGGERLLVRVAYDLWEGTGLVSVRELARRLDRANLVRVLEAISISRGELAHRPRVLHGVA